VDAGHPVEPLTTFVLSDTLDRIRIEGSPCHTIELISARTSWTANRIPVELVLRKLGVGMSPEAILADHPRLTQDDIDAAQKS
jgi:hypothetical protein